MLAFVHFSSPGMAAPLNTNYPLQMIKGQKSNLVDYESWYGLPEEVVFIFKESGVYNNFESFAENLKDEILGYESLEAMRLAIQVIITTSNEIENEADAISTLAENDAQSYIIIARAHSINPEDVIITEKYQERTLELREIIADEINNAVSTYNQNLASDRTNDSGESIVLPDSDNFEAYNEFIAEENERGSANLIPLIFRTYNYNTSQIKIAYENDPRNTQVLDEIIGTLVNYYSEGNVYYGESQIRSTILSAVAVMRNLIAGLAIIWIALSGIRMVVARGKEEELTKQRTNILYIVIGLIIILIIERMVHILYAVPTTNLLYPADGNPSYVNLLRPDDAFSAEVYALIHYIEALVGTIALAFIVLSGLRTIFAQGEEEEITRQRYAVLWVGVGVLLVSIDRLIVDNLFTLPAQTAIEGGDDVITMGNISNLIDTIGKIFMFALSFVGVAAFAMLIYGATFMIFNYGDDDLVERGKKTIKYAVMGIVVVISSYAVVNTLIVFQ